MHQKSKITTYEYTLCKTQITQRQESSYKLQCLLTYTSSNVYPWPAFPLPNLERPEGTSSAPFAPARPV